MELRYLSFILNHIFNVFTCICICDKRIKGLCLSFYLHMHMYQLHKRPMPSFNLVTGLVVCDRWQLRYEQFCKHILILYSVKGCNGNHAFSHSPKQVYFEDTFVSYLTHLGGLISNLTPMKKMLCGCTVS